MPLSIYNTLYLLKNPDIFRTEFTNAIIPKYLQNVIDKLNINS
jgi:hypothetical protein